MLNRHIFVPGKTPWSVSCWCGAMVMCILPLTRSASAEEPVEVQATHAIEPAELTTEGLSTVALGDEPLRLSPPRAAGHAEHSTGAWWTRVIDHRQKLGVLAMIVVAGVVLQRALGSSAKTGSLPDDVIQVFGKVKLSGRQQLHLVKVGSRLLLLVESASGVQSVSEIDDVQEVQRLTERFQGKAKRGRGSSAEVDKWLAAKAAAAGGH